MLWRASDTGNATGCDVWGAGKRDVCLPLRVGIFFRLDNVRNDGLEALPPFSVVI